MAQYNITPDALSRWSNSATAICREHAAARRFLGIAVERRVSVPLHSSAEAFVQLLNMQGELLQARNVAAGSDILGDSDAGCVSDVVSSRRWIN